MSRIGKVPIQVSPGVDVAFDDNVVSVKGPKGKLEKIFPQEVVFKYEDRVITVVPKDNTVRARAMWGLSRTLMMNMVRGVLEGWNKKLDLIGVGYRASILDEAMVLLILGYSHEVVYAIPEGITITCEKPTLLSISGIDKELVGQVAAEITGLRKHDPYKGKGIYYSGSFIRRKEGKKK